MIEKNSKIKIITLGDYGVGKTSIILKYMNDKFFSTSIKNLGNKFTLIIGCHYLSKNYVFENKIYEINIWDTESEERFGLMNRYYNDANGILLVFDLTKKNSFDNLKKWREELINLNLDKSAIYLIGTKFDLQNRQVFQNDISIYTNRYNYKYFETSSKTGMKINDIFDCMIREIIRKENKEHDDYIIIDKEEIYNNEVINKEEIYQNEKISNKIEINHFLKISNEEEKNSIRISEIPETNETKWELAKKFLQNIFQKIFHKLVNSK